MSTSVSLFLCFFILQMSTSASKNCVADLDIRFVICFVFLYYECRHPHQKIVLQGHPFHFFVFWGITDVDIRSRHLSCGCRHPFQFFLCFYLTHCLDAMNNLLDLVEWRQMCVLLLRGCETL